MTIRVGLVDDHPVVLSGLQAALATISDLSVVATAQTLAEGRSIAARDDVDVLLVDVRLPDGNGLELVSEVSRRGHPSTIVLSSFMTSQYVAAALRFGAEGFLLKTTPLEELIAAIRRVAAGGSTFTADQLREGRRGFVALTARERELLRLVLAGRSNDEIGGDMKVSRKTVEAHMSRLYERFGVASRIELALRAEREGWLDFAQSSG
jgi:DNA-binding NarL/FixJ family response regulator